jgi:hypothetical protein
MPAKFYAYFDTEGNCTVHEESSRHMSKRRGVRILLTPDILERTKGHPIHTWRLEKGSICLPKDPSKPPKKVGFMGVLANQRSMMDWVILLLGSGIGVCLLKLCENYLPLN